MDPSRSREPSTYTMRTEVLANRKGVSRPIVGYEYPPLLPTGNPIRLVHRPPTTNPHLQRQEERQRENRTSSPESTKLPIHHEIHAWEDQSLRLPITPSPPPRPVHNQRDQRHGYRPRRQPVYIEDSY